MSLQLSLWFILRVFVVVVVVVYFVFCVYILFFFFLHVDVQLFQHHLLKRLSFYCEINSLCSIVKDQLTIFVWIYFWIPYSVSSAYLSLFLPEPHFLDYCSFTVSLKRWAVSSLQPCSLLVWWLIYVSGLYIETLELVCQY